MNKNKIVILGLTVALAVSLTVNVVTWVLWPKNQATNNMQHANTTESSTTVPSTVKTQANVAMIDIDTPYGTLRYPAEYAEYLRYGSREENGIYMQIFYYLHGEETIEMFAVRFGNAESGTLIGSVEYEGQAVPCYITSSDFIPDETWSAEEDERYSAMLMAINDVIASVQVWENYIG